MSFIAEDGTGLDDANSLCTVAFADEYFADRGIAAWTGDASTVKEPALIRATDYLETRYGQRFAGTKLVEDQALSFPRTDIGWDEVVPTPVLKAVAEYALRAISGELAPDPVVTSTGLNIVAEMHKVGPITDTYRYASKGSGSTPALFRPYPAADGYLRGLVISTTGVIR